jgi:zinc transport system ATP-binding protein
MSFFLRKNKKAAADTEPKSGSTLISARNITLTIEKREVIKDLSFEICEGDYLCIIGENGSGKSTIISALLGLLKPSAGKIKFDHLTRNSIGVLPQRAITGTDSTSTVRETVTVGCLARGSHGPFIAKDSKDIAFSAMKKLDILDMADRPYRELSGGQRQKVMIARALCAAEKMLILDEPTEGLDKASIAHLYSLISDLNRQGITVVAVTHDVAAALKYSTKILRVNKDSYLFLDTEDYKKLPEAARFLQD